ncbi:hypothetical protein P168DRAFT_329730 [Aspergillus campestris IBT 28561]|uniref:F-box domain-containing protein n=1 Tax=Aspergillus campestris (strain IBT 28561) TaxID=1392248 RepID=A0A2I1CW36_ASPC2|nr:uncharacterized protein P168DRAFT_329730 [Aspergillus campestris IBT 28561]PKY01824.1 hypothetical protein P168DRAFT_329730 [Aspergillus campestris IBT 28561]
MPALIHMRLDSLPLNVVEIVLGFLDLQSVKSLRLVFRALSQSCNGLRSIGRLRHQTTDLSESSLESLSKLVSHGSLGSREESGISNPLDVLRRFLGALPRLTTLHFAAVHMAYFGADLPETATAHRHQFEAAEI